MNAVAENAKTHEAMKRKAVSFRPDIEGLRGIAVLLVVAFHAHIQLWRGGFLGVDIFFVLSGYLITALLLQELESSGTLNLVGFYARRARRLLPAAAVVVVFVVVAGIFLLSPIEQIRYSKTALATTLYSSNLWFIHQSSDYFAADTANNPLLHTWSLAVEEQFYFVWPVLVWIGFRMSRSRSGLCKFLAGISGLSLVACIWLTQTNQPWAFFGSPARAWEFGVGGIACMVPVTFFKNKYGRFIVSWISLLIVLGAAMWFHPGEAFPGSRALIPALATALLLIVGAAEVTAGAGRMLGHPILQSLGRLSYSWYLMALAVPDLRCSNLSQNFGLRACGGGASGAAGRICYPACNRESGPLQSRLDVAARVVPRAGGRAHGGKPQHFTGQLPFVQK